MVKIDETNGYITFLSEHFSLLFGTTTDLSDIYEGKYTKNASDYTDAIDWLKKVKNAPEFWNSIMGDTDSIIVDPDKVEQILQWDTLFDL